MAGAAVSVYTREDASMNVGVMMLGASGVGGRGHALRDWACCILYGGRWSNGPGGGSKILKVTSLPSFSSSRPPTNIPTIPNIPTQPTMPLPEPDARVRVRVSLLSNKHAHGQGAPVICLLSSLSVSRWAKSASPVYEERSGLWIRIWICFRYLLRRLS